jgi:predicted house-cleaning noncanonical NTP pyrophosphatase (MazG superfamily)
MDVMEILKKVTDGQTLSSEERKSLSEFRPQGIPKSRLDAEIAKRKDVEQQNNELNKTLGKLSSRVDELETRDLSEQEKLEKNYSVELKQLREHVSSLTTERNFSKQELEQIRFQQKVGKLAKEKQFNDSQYLGFMLKKANVSLESPDQIEEFMTELRDSSPKLFHLELRSGSGSSPGGHEMEFSSAKQSGNINAMLANAPEITN